MIRKRFHRMGVREGFKAVWSPEKVSKSQIIESRNETNRASIVGSVSWMPAAFGIVCASAVIRELAGITY
ncbi:MAG: hypothetical protein ACUVTX_01670 [Bacteroidales bacterium]